MKKGLKKNLFMVAIILVVILFFMFVSYKSSSKSNFFPYIGWGNVCSAKCYLNQLLGNTMITNHPVLDIFDTLGPNSYRYDLYVQNKKNMSLNISALNIGKSTIPYANVSFILEDSDIFQHVLIPYWLSDDWSVRNLSAMDSKTNHRRIWFKVKDDVTLNPGKYNLKFRVICPICDEQVYYDYISICIYERDPIEDCGEIWWYDNWDFSL